MTDQTRLLVVSNRLPIAMTRTPRGLEIRQGAGGLVTALAPVLRDRGGLWLGWAGASADENLRQVLADFSLKAGYDLHAVPLSEEDIKEFYLGFSNEIIWPLFHEFQMPCNFLPRYWDTYLKVNRTYARELSGLARPEDFVWVHDYQLMHVAHYLKETGLPNHTGFFLHIPFPPVDIFSKLPWRKQIVSALLEYDLVGFQTLRDRRNFTDSVRRFFPEAVKRGRGQVVSVRLGERTVRVGAFPISVDHRDFAGLARNRSVREQARSIRKAFGNKRIVLSVDRLDYTKGISHRLESIRVALAHNPDLKDRVCFLQVVVPSREDIPQYQERKVQIEQMISEINGTFATPGWSPVHYYYRMFTRPELVAYYLASDMGLVTSLRDGMNLVAKEYVACDRMGQRALCLSEFAGAAVGFERGALIINPFDTRGTAEAIRGGLEMPARERRERMRRMRDLVKKYDIFWWVDSFLTVAFGRHLSDFPPLEQERSQVWSDLALEWEDGPEA
jgi:trehalose 6-phosphate synthase